MVEKLIERTVCVQNRETSVASAGHLEGLFMEREVDLAVPRFPALGLGELGNQKDMWDSFWVNVVFKGEKGVVRIKFCSQPCYFFWKTHVTFEVLHKALGIRISETPCFWAIRYSFWVEISASFDKWLAASCQLWGRDKKPPRPVPLQASRCGRVLSSFIRYAAETTAFAHLTCPFQRCIHSISCKVVLPLEKNLGPV